MHTLCVPTFFICAYSAQKIAFGLWRLLIINQLLSSFFSISPLCYFTWCMSINVVLLKIIVKKFCCVRKQLYLCIVKRQI